MKIRITYSYRPELVEEVFSGYWLAAFDPFDMTKFEVWKNPLDSKVVAHLVCIKGQLHWRIGKDFRKPGASIYAAAITVLK